MKILFAHNWNQTAIEHDYLEEIIVNHFQEIDLNGIKGICDVPIMIPGLATVLVEVHWSNNRSTLEITVVE